MAEITTSDTTLEYFDGFDDYSSSQITRYWTSEVSYSPVTRDLLSIPLDSDVVINGSNGRNSSSSLRTIHNNKAVLIVLTPVATRTVGVAVKLSTFANSAIFVGFSDVNKVQCGVLYNADGTLSVIRGGAQSIPVTVLSTSTQSLSINVYYYVEFTATINNSSGSYTLKINGSTWLTGSSQNTRNTANNTCNGVFIGQGGTDSTGTTVDFDDFYSRADNTFLGDCRVESKLPSANGDTIQWTPLTGTNYANVNENPATDDTTYNTSAAAGNIDQYMYPVLSSSSGSVFAVMTVPVLRVDTAGVATACSSYRALGTDYVGGTHYVGATTYTAYMDIKGHDPSTSVNWTVPGVNAAQFGVKRLS